MKRTNSIGKILLLSLLTSLLFSVSAMFAFELLEASTILIVLAILAFICLVLMFTQDVNRIPNYPVDCDQPMMRHWRRYR
jgi:hypothetical protein